MSTAKKFSQVLASGEGVDLAWTGWLINKPQNIADGNLMPLDDLLAEYGGHRGYPRRKCR